MNIPRHLRSVVVCLLLICAAAFGQSLTIQLPLARSSHSFSLWEFSDYSDPLAIELTPGLAPMGIPAGFYRQSSVFGLSLAGGEFNSDGVWVPGQGAAMNAVANRSLNGLYFIRDDSTGEGAWANHSLLTNSVWKPLNGGEGLFFYSLPAERFDHLLVVNVGNPYPDTGDPWSGWFPLTPKPIQNWYDLDGTALSLGFFEGWTYGPSDFEYAYVYDFSTGELANSFGPDLTTASLWVPASPSFWPLTPVRIWTGDQYGETFELISPGGAPQLLYATEPNADYTAYGVSAYVGLGKEFWLRRISDDKISSQWSIGWGVVNGTIEFNAVGTFSGGPPPEDWQYLFFRVGTNRDHSGWKVRRAADGVETPLDLPNWNYTYVYDYTGTQSVWVDWYEGYTHVNVEGGWTIVDQNGADLGQGPDFIDWPSFPGPSATLVIPHSHFGDDMVVNPGNGRTLSYLGAFGTISFQDPVTNETMYVDLDSYQLPEPGSYFYLIDNSTGDESPWFYYYSGTTYDLSTWNAGGEILLKISATRWYHDVYVLCATGEMIPVSKGSVQGDWSIDSYTGQSYFNSYGYFNATGRYRINLPWYLYDATAGEYLQASMGDGSDFTNATDNTDTDQDGLPDWYERMIGTNPNSVDTDGDGVWDGAEVQAGTNPRAGNAATMANATLKVFTPLE